MVCESCCFGEPWCLSKPVFSRISQGFIGMALCIYSINILPSKKTENSSRCLIFYLASILTFFLKNNLAFYLAFYLTFKSGILFFLARRWGLWVPTDIWRSQLRSSSAAVPTEIWSSRLKSGHATVIWCLQLRSWGKRVGEEGEEKGGEGRDAPLIKSRDPHGRLESPIAWNFIVIPPSPTGCSRHQYHSVHGILLGDTVGMPPLAAHSAASTSSASLCFHAKLPAKLAFVLSPRPQVFFSHPEHGQAPNRKWFWTVELFWPKESGKHFPYDRGHGNWWNGSPHKI